MNMIFQKYKVLFSVLLLVFMMLGYIIPNRNMLEAKKNVAAIMQKQVQSDEVLLREIMLDLREVLITNGKKAYERKSLDYQEKYKERFAFYLYDNHHLDLWTDNHIPFPEDVGSLGDKKFQSLGSYQVLISNNSFQQFSMIGVQIIKMNYPWQNNYLINHIAPYFNISAELMINQKDGFPINNSIGEPLFYIQLNKIQVSNDLTPLPFLLFILSFFLFAYIIKSVLAKIHQSKPLIALFAFTLSVFLWFGVHILLALPVSLFRSQLFSPSLYANAWINQSLGHLFFYSLGLLAIVIYYYSNFKNRKVSNWWLIIYMSIIYSLFFGFVLLVNSLVFDSQINLNLHHIASLNIHSYVVLWILFILQISWFLLLDRWLSHFAKVKGTEIYLWLFVVISLMISYLISPEEFYQYWVFYVFINSLVILVFYFKSRDTFKPRVGEILLYLILFTFITTYYINELSFEKEKQLRQIKALSFNLENDPFLETSFLSAAQEIPKNKQIKEILLDGQIERLDDSLLLLITDKYFSNYLNTYNVNLIYCDQGSLINIMPENVEYPCFEYFEDRISKAQSIIAKDTLYLIDGSFQSRHYIGEVSVKIDSISFTKIFIEFVSTEKPKEMGLPAILEKSHVRHNRSMRNYSYAIYHNGLLTEWYGKYDYKQKLKDYRLESVHDFFFKKDAYSHYIYSKDKDNIIIISKNSSGMLQIFASYAFVFLIYSILIFLLYSLVFTTAMHSSIGSFQGRLQYSMIFLLLFSFLLIGITSLYYIFYLNQNKNEDLLMEKAHSVLIELEHKISSISDFQAEDRAYVESLLIKFSEVFFTDITLYNEDGKLLASSRPEMFTADLLSDRMDAGAYYELNFLKNSYFIQDEKIGTQSYLSAYLPFRNQENQSVAYLNLPYFAKQYELEEEVSGFIVAFLNIYLLLLFITIIITVAISRYLSKPILLIRDKMQHLELDQKNEKIEWDKDDEIGELVKEYNRMVDELSLSAQKLAITQRESAWREMAQQIAHEIKNPLTPMMLNVQYLERAWSDGAEDYEERMLRITKGLKEQIEVLSNIAGQFSSFAAIDKLSLENVNLNIIIDDVIAIFKANEHIQFIKLYDAEDCIINADKSQMIRILNNIYKNAIQAIANTKEGKIITELNIIEGKQALISIRDNGCGIAAEELKHIFEPHFTTKTSGMGLGLALVKKMTENIGGSITVKSELGEGSTFVLLFPLK